MRPHAHIRLLVIGTMATALLAMALGATALADVASDDQLPGVARALPISLADSLQIGSDPTDVSSIHLNAGQMLKVGLTGDDGTDFSVALLSSAATSTQDFGHFVAGSFVVGTSTEAFNYEPKTAGDFYLVVYMHTFTGGSYSLSAAVVTQKVSALSGPSSAKHGKWFTLSGYVTPQHNGAKDTTVYWYRSVHGKWKSAGSLKLAPVPLAGTDRSVFAIKYRGPAGKMRFRAAHVSGTSVIYSPWKNVTIK